MKIGVDDIFDQIINICVDDLDKEDNVVLKNIRLDLKENYEYDRSMGYVMAYQYLYECLLLDYSDNYRQKALDLFLVHQYLCYVYFETGSMDDLLCNDSEIENVLNLMLQCFSYYRYIGAYEDCIDLYELVYEQKIWSLFDKNQKMKIMKETAKSYRNVGDFRNSLRLYFACIEMNLSGDWIQKVELLLKVGKVYRNYLMQLGLAKFFVEEAYKILKEKGKENPSDDRERKYKVICLDTMGQIYRDEGEFDKAKDFFELARRTYGGTGGRAVAHQVLLKYKENDDFQKNYKEDISTLFEIINNMRQKPEDERGIGIRSIQLGKILFDSKEDNIEKAYIRIYEGRTIAYRYNDIKTIIRSYKAEAELMNKQGKFEEERNFRFMAMRIASRNNQLVLENEIIKEMLETCDTIDSVTKIELIKRRKIIYRQLVDFSKYTIKLVQKNMSNVFETNRLIEIYEIVLKDFEQIFDELNKIVEILDVELDNINQKYVAYLDTEIKGFTYKSILHRFKNDLPNDETVNSLIKLCNKMKLAQPEMSNDLKKIIKQLGAFRNIIAHIKTSAIETLNEAKEEKEWFSFEKLINNGIQNYIYTQPKYEKCIKCHYPERDIQILVQRTLLETAIIEIINNAFDYAESVMSEEVIRSFFTYTINMRIEGEHSIILECVSEYFEKHIADTAFLSINNGIKYIKSTKKSGSMYGFYLIKMLFADFMGGRVEAIQNINKVGIIIKAPISLAKIRIGEGDKKNGSMGIYSTK